MKRIAAVLAFLLLPTLAAAQVNLNALGPNTVIGRLGIPAQGGPAQAIPFAALVQALSAAQPTCSANTVMAGPTTGAAAIPSCRSLVANDIPGGVLPAASTASYATRSAAVAATIDAAIKSVFLQGYATANDGGGGWYSRLSGAPVVKAWHFQSADGTYWLLNTPAILPRQVGAVLDGLTDDTTAMQAWLDYGVAFGVPALGQSGTARIPTSTLTLAGNQVVDGGNVLTIKRTTDTVAAVMECTTHDNIEVRNTAFNTTAGFSSTSSNTIGLTTQNYTVPAGLTGLVVGQFVQITANSTAANRINYEIAQINSYSGTTLNVTATTVNGSGTFAAWLIDVYPQNGNFGSSNIGLRFTTCNNIRSYGNTFTGRFYNALDSRNGDNVYFIQNRVSGHVNRGIHAADYTTGVAENNQIIGNVIDCASFGQYGVNTSATDSGVGRYFTIAANQVSGCTFQGIIVAGSMSYSSISNNNVTMALSTNGAGIIVESVSTFLTERIVVNGNTVNKGLQGIFVLDVTYSNFTGNQVSAAGTGYLISGSAATSTAYNTFTGNLAQGSTSHGFSFSGSVATGVTGTNFVGNIAVSSGGTGVITNANTSNGNYSANSSIANGTAYSFAGTGNIVNGTNL